MLPIYESPRAIQAPSAQTGRATASTPRAGPGPALHGASRFFRSLRFTSGALRIVAGALGRWRPGGTRVQALRHEPADLLHDPAEVRRKRKQRTVAGQARAQGAVEALRRCAEICAHTVRSSSGGVGCGAGSPDRSEVRHFDPQEDDRKAAGGVPLKKKPLSVFVQLRARDLAPVGQTGLGRLMKGCGADFWPEVPVRSKAMSVGTGSCGPDWLASSNW